MLSHQWFLSRGYKDKHPLNLFLWTTAVSGAQTVKKDEFYIPGKILFADENEFDNQVVFRIVSGGKESIIVLNTAFLKISLCTPTDLKEYIYASVNTNDIIVVIQSILACNTPVLKVGKVYGRVGSEGVKFAEEQKSGEVEESSSSQDEEEGDDGGELDRALDKDLLRNKRMHVKEIVVQRKRKVQHIEGSEISEMPKEKKRAPGCEIKSKEVDRSIKLLNHVNANKRVVDTMRLSTATIKRPPKDASGERPLQVRKLYSSHVEILKDRMRANQEAVVTPMIVMVDPTQCTSLEKYNKADFEYYHYYVLGGTHSYKARKELMKEDSKNPAWKVVEAKVYVGLTDEEAKVLAISHNVDNEYRLQMSFIDQIRFMHREFINFEQTYGEDFRKDGTLLQKLRETCVTECCLRYDSDLSPTQCFKKFDNYFQLAFRSGKIWELQEKIFSMFQDNQLKTKSVTEKAPKASKKLSKPAKVKEMNIVPWTSLQGIKDKELLVHLLEKVVEKEFTLEEMANEAKQQKDIITCQLELLKALNLDAWEDCRANYPMTTTDALIKEYAPNFSKWKKSNGLPAGFLNLVRRCKEERQKLKAQAEGQAALAASANDLDNFYLLNQDALYKVVVGDCRLLKQVIQPRNFTLCIADIPYGFKIKDSRFDDKAFTWKEVEAFLEGFKEVTTSSYWRVILFHSDVQTMSVIKPLSTICNAGFEGCVWVKTNVKGNGGGARLVSKLEHFHIGYYSVDGKRSMQHYNTTDETQPPSNVFPYPAVLQKLKDPQRQGQIVSHYQKPQKLICKLISWFSRPGDWVLDAFSGSGTTAVCALKKGRNVISVDIDPDNVSFIKTRISSCESLPDENQELGDKSFSGTLTETFSEIQPPPSGRPDEEVVFAELNPATVFPEETPKASPRIPLVNVGLENEKEKNGDGEEEPVDF